MRSPAARNRNKRQAGDAPGTGDDGVRPAVDRSPGGVEDGEEHVAARYSRPGSALPRVERAAGVGIARIRRETDVVAGVPGAASATDDPVRRRGRERGRDGHARGRGGRDDRGGGNRRATADRSARRDSGTIGLNLDHDVVGRRPGLAEVERDGGHGRAGRHREGLGDLALRSAVSEDSDCGAWRSAAVGQRGVGDLQLHAAVRPARIGVLGGGLLPVPTRLADEGVDREIVVDGDEVEGESGIPECGDTRVGDGRAGACTVGGRPRAPVLDHIGEGRPGVDILEEISLDVHVVAASVRPGDDRVRSRQRTSDPEVLRGDNSRADIELTDVGQD